MKILVVCRVGNKSNDMDLSISKSFIYNQALSLNKRGIKTDFFN